MIFWCLLFVAYFFFFLYCNKKTAFFINSGISSRNLNILFSIKILVGITYIVVHECFIKVYDLTVLFSDSLQETELLLHQPLKFISTTFDSDYQNKYGGLLTTGSYWNDISTTLLTKLLGICNVLSFKNLYINILLYNYLIFYGHIALYRAFCTVWRNGKTGALIGCFFIPSSIFYLSGINKF